MSTHQVHVFISHSWAYSGHYDTLASWVFDQTWRFGQASVDFRNFSVPETDPILNASNDKALRDAIYKQIAMSHVIVIPTGMYAHYSKWIGKEIDGAGVYSKPILAVDLRGAQRTASVVSPRRPSASSGTPTQSSPASGNSTIAECSEWR